MSTLPNPTLIPAGPRDPDDYPDFIPIGASIRLVSLRAFCRDLRVTTCAASVLLKRLGVPVWRPFPSKRAYYFSIYALEKVLFEMLAPRTNPPRGRAGAIIKAFGEEPSENECRHLTAEQMEVVGRLYGHMTAQQIRHKLGRKARYFRRAGDALLRKELARLQQALQKATMTPDTGGPPSPPDVSSGTSEGESCPNLSATTSSSPSSPPFTPR